MANVVTRIATPMQRAKASLAKRTHIRPGIRVEPSDDPTGRKRWTADDMRRLLKHPRAGGFRSEGALEWPNDVFTQRRLKEGAIKAAEAKAEKPKAPAHHQRSGEA